MRHLPEVTVLNASLPDFCDIFKQKPAIIAEIKFASPSAGRIYKGALHHQEIALQYLNNGAAALSILTEPVYFQGQTSYLQEIRHMFPQVHLLAKDFILHQQQIAHAVSNGANAVLLVVAFLTPDLLRQLHDFALSLGVTPLIEVHNAVELEIALRLSPKVIGINNRCLKTLTIDLATSRSLIDAIPQDCFAVCESGINHGSQINEFTALGFDGFLVGSSLMTAENPGQALSRLLLQRSS